MGSFWRAIIDHVLFSVVIVRLFAVIGVHLRFGFIKHTGDVAGLSTVLHVWYGARRDRSIAITGVDALPLRFGLWNMRLGFIGLQRRG